MKPAIIMLAVCSVGFSTVQTQGDDVRDSKWRVGVGYRSIFNLKASFENSGNAQSLSNPSGGGNSYSDGFVGVDSTGNALGLTTYWGYQRSEQYAGDAIVLRNSKPGALGEDDNLWANGCELTVGRELGQGRNIKWGVEGGFGYAHIDAAWDGMAKASVLSLDAFPLGGIVPPTAPYEGPQTSGPGSPLLGTTPTTIPMRVNADLDASIYTFRLGPYAEFPLAKCCSLTIAAGFSMAVIDSEIAFRESTVAELEGLAETHHGEKADAVFGGYISGQLNVRLGKGWSAFSGVQFHSTSDFDQRVGGKDLKLDLGSAFALTFGIQYQL